MALIATSSLDANGIAHARARLGDHPMHRFYFESALEALSDGIDNRMHHLSPAGGIVQAIAFDDKLALSTHGPLDADDLALIAAVPNEMELHVQASQRAALEARLGPRVARVRELKYYRRLSDQMAIQDPAEAPDPRCRRLGEADYGLVRAFLREHYDGTVLSDWMNAWPFVGCFDDEALVCVAGVVAGARPGPGARPGAGAGAGAGAASRRTAIVGNLFTDPAGRGRGVATAAVRALIGVLVEEGYRNLLLATTEDNVAAWRIAEALGFELIERRVQIDVDPA
jgi:RimJ/RimL family protein N-acetyltransferase